MILLPSMQGILKPYKVIIANLNLTKNVFSVNFGRNGFVESTPCAHDATQLLILPTLRLTACPKLIIFRSEKLQKTEWELN
jgi:hypothetical protein